MTGAVLFFLIEFLSRIYAYFYICLYSPELWLCFIDRGLLRNKTIKQSGYVPTVIFSSLFCLCVSSPLEVFPFWALVLNFICLFFFPSSFSEKCFCVSINLPFSLKFFLVSFPLLSLIFFFTWQGFLSFCDYFFFSFHLIYTMYSQAEIRTFKVRL